MIHFWLHLMFHSSLRGFIGCSYHLRLLGLAPLQPEVRQEAPGKFSNCGMFLHPLANGSQMRSGALRSGSGNTRAGTVIGAIPRCLTEPALGWSQIIRGTARAFVLAVALGHATGTVCAGNPDVSKITARIDKLLWGKTLQGRLEMTVKTPALQRTLKRLVRVECRIRWINGTQ